jgi:hypothetical protein
MIQVTLFSCPVTAMIHVIHKKHFKLRPEFISYVVHILEGYEGLCNVTTVDTKKAIIEVFVTDDFIPDFQEVADCLSNELYLQETDIKLEETENS